MGLRAKAATDIGLPDISHRSAQRAVWPWRARSPATIDMLYLIGCDWYALTDRLWLICSDWYAMTDMLWLICYDWYAITNRLWLICYDWYAMADMLWLICYEWYAMPDMLWMMCSCLIRHNKSATTRPSRRQREAWPSRARYTVTTTLSSGSTAGSTLTNT